MSNDRPTGIRARIAEDPLCARIPEDDDPFFVRGDNRIGFRGKNGFSESSMKVHCVLVELTVAVHVFTFGYRRTSFKCRRFVQGDVVRFITFDFVLRIVRSRVVSVPFVLGVFQMHFD